MHTPFALFEPRRIITSQAGAGKSDLDTFKPEKKVGTLSFDN